MSSSLLSAAEPVCPPLDLYAPIAADLEKVERILAESLRNQRGPIAALLDRVSHYRGKRLRPALLLLVARACGNVTPAHHVLGAVVEMIHSATLVHDDILDGATVRRHVATVNADWGTQTSILLGDYLFTHAFHLCSTLGDAQACQIIGEATNRTCEGELRQGVERGNLELNEAEYLEIVEGKTADLIACCCRLGALFAGAPAEAVEALTRFGRGLGIAFQIADDLLDLVGEEHSTGKSLGTDLEQCKLTLPLIHMLRTTASSVSGRLRQILTNPGNHKRESLRPYFAASTSLEYAHRRAEEFAEAASRELSCLEPSPCRTILEALCERVVHRDH